MQNRTRETESIKVGRKEYYHQEQSAGQGVVVTVPRTYHVYSFKSKIFIKQISKGQVQGIEFYMEKHFFGT